MNGIIVQAKLTDLVSVGEHSREVIQLCARVQAQHARYTGHLLDYCTPYTWLKLKGACRTSFISDVIVTCMRCGTPARLTEWNSAAQCAKAGLKPALEEVGNCSKVRILDVYSPCKGDEIARGMASWNAV